jgi:hypothetical protein
MFVSARRAEGREAAKEPISHLPEKAHARNRARPSTRHCCRTPDVCESNLHSVNGTTYARTVSAFDDSVRVRVRKIEFAYWAEAYRCRT